MPPSAPHPQTPTAPQPTPQQQVPQRDVAILDGVLERVTFSNPETGYTIARIAPDRGTGRGPVSASTELITAVGPLLGAQIGESLRLRGRWTSHMKYGRQFDVHSYTTVLPATEQGIRRYLGSGLIKGIGPVMAERMVNHFGVEIMHIIDDEPGRLIEVPGLGPKRSTRIKDAWAEQKAIKQVMIFLQGVGVSTSLAVKIYKKYGDESEKTVQQQPYKLASDVWGIGFKTADTIAASVGIAKDSPERIKAGLAYTLSEAADDGHCYLPEPSLVTDAAKILEVPADLIAPRSSNPCRSRALRPPSRCGPSTSRPFSTLNGPSRLPSATSSLPAKTGCPPSSPWSGTRPSAGSRRAPAPTSPPSRPMRSSWPSPRRSRC